MKKESIKNDLLTSKDFVRIGYSSGLTGYKGAVKVTPEPDFEEDFFDRLEFVYFRRDGMYVPFFIREKSPRKQTLKFERIGTREEAQHLTDQPLYLRKRDLPAAVLEKSSRRPELFHLEGFLIFDLTADREAGHISNVEEYPGGWMAEIMDDSEELLLIPLAEPLIERIDEEKETIYMHLPEGLTEL